MYSTKKKTQNHHRRQLPKGASSMIQQHEASFIISILGGHFDLQQNHGFVIGQQGVFDSASFNFHLQLRGERDNERELEREDKREVERDEKRDVEMAMDEKREPETNEQQISAHCRNTTPCTPDDERCSCMTTDLHCGYARDPVLQPNNQGHHLPSNSTSPQLTSRGTRARGTRAILTEQLFHANPSHQPSKHVSPRTVSHIFQHSCGAKMKDLTRVDCTFMQQIPGTAGNQVYIFNHGAEG